MQRFAGESRAAISRRLSAWVVASVVAVVGCGATGTGSDAGPGLSLEAVEPTVGPLAGDNMVTLRGAGFRLTPNSVLFGDVISPNVRNIDDNTLIVVAPAGALSGVVDITVFNTSGYSVLTGAYSYNRVPAITSVAPGIVDAAGGDTITLRGSGFLDEVVGGTVVLVGDIAATATVVDDTTITVEVPGGAPFSTVDIVVQNSNGNAEITGALDYTAAGLLAATRGFGDPNLFYFLEVDSGRVTAIPRENPETATRYTGLARAPNGTLYAVDTSNPQILWKLNVDGSEVEVGPLAATSRIVDIAFVGATLYAAQKAQGELGTIDLITGMYEPVGGTLINGGGSGLAASGSTLYYVRGDPGCCRGRNPRLHTINPVDGTLLGGGIPLEGEAWGGAAILDGELYAVNVPTSEVYRINTVTGALELVGAFPLTYSADSLEGIE